MLADVGILIFNKEAKRPRGLQMSALDKNSILPPALSDYLDYRLFLQDFYHYKKELTKNDLRPYSYQLFSAAANIKSPNYLKMIIEGQRNLSDDMILKFAKALQLNKEQTEEFLHLVKLNQAEDTTERNVYLKKLSEVRINQKLKSGEIDRRIWEKIPNWVAWVIYAMIDQEGVSFDIHSLKALLRNKASEQEIEAALNSLISSGEIRKDPVTGEMKRAHNLMDSADEIPVALVRKLQMQLMYIGLESLYQEAPQEREFGTLTLSLTKEEFEETKFKLRQLRKTLNKDNAIARKEKKGERIYQINIQLFPVTDVAKTDTLAAGKVVNADETATPVKKSVQDLAQEAMKAANLFETEGQI
ncbi:MAG: TIGR02147 family protein [Bdellovibrionaceae bacterium]|nr:TIGR02147 family protein [Pseudobdellovibrionaceae bacterium]